VKLVETDADRPEDDVDPPPVATAPRPEKRSAYASLIMTACVLVGTVATIYSIFPARKNETIYATLRNHRDTNPRWDLPAPTRVELEAWSDGVLGDRPPLPEAGADLTTLGARELVVRHRRGVYVRFALGDGGVAYQVSYVVQHAGDAPAGRTSRRDGDEHLESWREGEWTCIAVGPAAKADQWKPRIGVP
jgi:hypothetical protein